MNIATILGAIKNVALIFKSVLIAIEKMRDGVIDKKTREKKEEINKFIAELKNAKEQGASDDEIINIHRRMHDDNWL